MKGFVYPIVIAVVLVVLILRLRGRGRGKSPARRLASLAMQRWSHRRRSRANPLGDAGLVAGREIHERLRGRFFKVITLVLLAVIAAAIVIPTLHSSSRTVVKVGVVGSAAAAQEGTATAALARIGLSARFVTETSRTDARAALRSGDATVVVDGDTLLVKTSVAGKSTTVAAAAAAIASALGVERAFRSAGLTASQAIAVGRAKPLPIHSLAVRQSSATRGTSVIGLIFIFILLTQYLTWTLVGVMEEKTSRVVEVLLATVRPVQLLGGKVLGIGVVALLQAGLVVAFALSLADAVGSDLLKGTAPIVVVASLVWLVLAYAFYSWVFAAAGSMVERQDQAQSLSLPLSVPIIVGYVLALVNAGPGPPSVFIKVLAYLPPTAPFAMPLLVSKGAVSWWEFVIAALLSVACTVAVARFAATVYRRAVLRTGRRLHLREVLAAHR